MARYRLRRNLESAAIHSAIERLMRGTLPRARRLKE
jgi:hypothetical protein